MRKVQHMNLSVKCLYRYAETRMTFFLPVLIHRFSGVKLCTNIEGKLLEILHKTCMMNDEPSGEEHDC